VPLGPPNITKTFLGLKRKLQGVKEPELKLAVIDYWIGRLFDLRAQVEFGEAYQKRR
jgi:hypothetical protein